MCGVIISYLIYDTSTRQRQLMLDNIRVKRLENFDYQHLS